MKSASGGGETLLLLVEPDEDDRERFGGWLEGSGFGVMDCPGPSSVEFTCLGVRGQPCPLLNAADLVILDLRLLSDAYQEKAPSRRLLRYYLDRGKPVILLGEMAPPRRYFRDNGVTVLPRPTRRSLVSTVRWLME
jgi:hypothetical protein